MCSRIALDEGAVVVRARALVRDAGIDAVPVDLSKYLARAGADLRSSSALAANEAGNTMFVKGRHVITVNANDSPERRRFTALHEIGHIVLDLPSEHGPSLSTEGLYRYARRPKEEALCDAFAAECLLPHGFLRRDLDGFEPGFDFVHSISERYSASLTSASSRIAANCPGAVASILSQDGYVRAITLSASMRTLGLFVPLGIAVPKGSVTRERLERGHAAASAGAVEANVWTSSDAAQDVELQEVVLVLPAWGQALTQLWCHEDSNEIPSRQGEVDDALLKELDGNLPWPSGKKRR
jgi:Zn-dependent peptidase ImmA (M78 family)